MIRRKAKRGRHVGRRLKLDTPKKIAMAQPLHNEGTHSINDICQTLACHERRSIGRSRFGVIRLESTNMQSNQRAHSCQSDVLLECVQ